jgi:hypothetical protein
MPPTRLSRRQFLQLLLWSLFAMRTSSALAKAVPEIAAPSNGPRAAFEQSLRAFVDVLIPADALSPAASAVGVDAHIIALSKNDYRFRKLLNVGFKWLDSQISGGFAQLPEDAQIRVVDWMSQADGNSLPLRLFEILRYESMSFYYADHRSWQGLSIQRPPQPVGYPDHAG